MAGTAVASGSRKDALFDDSAAAPLVKTEHAQSEHRSEKKKKKKDKKEKKDKRDKVSEGLTLLGGSSFARFCQQEFGEFHRLVGRYCSYLLPKQDKGTP